MTALYIAGLGLQTVAQTTREVEAAIRSSREVLFLDTGVATKSFLETLCPRVTPLYEQSYSEGRPRVSARRLGGDSRLTRPTTASASTGTAQAYRCAWAR